MRPLSLVTAAAVLAAACSAPIGASAQDRYSRGVVYTPAAPSVYTQASPAPYTQASPHDQPSGAPYAGRMLSWPGKVGGPQTRSQPAFANLAPPPAPRAAQPAPARDRYASINSAPDTAGRPYANPVRPQTPAPQPYRAPVAEQPIRQAAAPAPERMIAPPAQRAPLPQSIYDAPPPPAPEPERLAAPAPQRAPVQQAFVAPDPDFQGPYPPATKEPWRRFLGDTRPAQGQGVAVPLPDAQAAPAAPAPKAPAKAAEKPVKPAKTAGAAPPPQRMAVAPAGYHNGDATSSTRFYSVHRQFGVEPDPIKMPQQFFLDGAPDLSEPPPPPVRRIAPTPGKSTAAIRAAQARAQESPDAG